MKIHLGVLLLPVAVFLSGCTLFNRDTHKKSIQREIGKDSVAIEREQYRRHNRKFVCLVVARDNASARYDEEIGDWTGSEIEIVRKKAMNLRLNVDFVGIDRFAVAAALRNGRGDMAVGQFTEAEIQAMHMRACAPYILAKPAEKKPATDEKKSETQPSVPPTEPQKYYFVIRRADDRWASDLAAD